MSQAAEQTGIDEKVLASWEKTIGELLPHKSMYQVLRVLLRWADPEEHPSITDPMDRGKQVNWLKALALFEPSERTSETKKAMKREHMDRYATIYEEFGEALDLASRRHRIEIEVNILNEGRPKNVGPVVICDEICLECGKWTPSSGRNCMHCGVRSSRERPESIDFTAPAPNSKPE
jgi:ribosomal protein L32